MGLSCDAKSFNTLSIACMVVEIIEFECVCVRVCRPCVDWGRALTSENGYREPPILLQTVIDPLITFIDHYGNPLPFCEPLWTHYPPLRTTTRPLPPAIHHTILYRMADTSKQIDEG